jgi:membrane associated rhomboid family serine protease
MALPIEWQASMESFKNSVRGFFGGNKEAPRPRMCPACGNLVGISATRCPNCGTSLNFSLAAAGRGVSGIFGGNAPATTMILIVNCLMFAVTLVSSMQAGGLSISSGVDGQILYKLGAVYSPAIFLGHQWFRLVTAMFLHGSIMHIALNMWVLWSVGPVIEEAYGSARYLFVYTFTGIAGFVLSALRGNFSVGASGALLGLVGVMLAITTKRGGAAMQAQRSRLIVWIVIIFAQGLLPGLNVDNWAHFGGLAAGFTLGRIFVDRQPERGPETTRAYLLGWIAAAVLIASFGMMIFELAATRT